MLLSHYHPLMAHGWSRGEVPRLPGGHKSPAGPLGRAGHSLGSRAQGGWLQPQSHQTALLPDPGLPRGPLTLFSTVSFTLGQTQRRSTRAMPELQVPVGGGAEVIEVPGVSSPALFNVLGNPSIPFLQSVSEQAILL